MKRMLTILLLLCLFVPTLANADTYTLSELQEKYDGQRWQADYETIRNETIHVDVEIALPDADAIDVWNAEYRKPVKGYVSHNNEAQIHADKGFFACTWPDEGTRKQITQQAKKAGLSEIYAEPAPLVLQYGWFDLNTAYSVNNGLTVQAAWDAIQGEANRFFAGEDIHLSPHLVHAHVNPGKYKYNKNSGDYELVKEIPDFKGVLFVMYDQLVDGVPVLALDSSKTGYSAWSIMQSMADYGIDSYSYHMAFQLVTPLKHAKKNVSVCSPEKIIHQAENMIQEGKLRSVYCLRLGYTVQSKGKDNLQLIPAWVIEGELFKDAKAGYQNHPTLLSVGTLEETQISFDARTGEMIGTRRMQYQ